MDGCIANMPKLLILSKNTCKQNKKSKGKKIKAKSIKGKMKGIWIWMNAINKYKE